MVLGSGLTLNSLVILVSLIFWLWIWGIIGGLLTVPLLFCAKIMIQRVAGHRVAAIIG
jgi:predicted PurR-regulated permease PerM